MLEGCSINDGQKQEGMSEMRQYEQKGNEQNESDEYRIAGNFRGRKLSWIGRKGAFRGILN